MKYPGPCRAPQGNLPPGKYAIGELEDCGDCAVWWYELPGEKIRWAFALHANDGVSWAVSAPRSGFLTRADAVRFGAIARSQSTSGPKG